MNKTIFKKMAAKGAEIDLSVGVGHAIGRYSEKNKIEHANLSNQELHNKLDNLQNSVDKVNDAINNIPSLNANTNNNKLIFDFDFNIDSFYAYLDSITMVQELAIIHILFSFLFFITAFELLSIFFGNEIINHFDLENKYPKLKIFFKIRTTYQRYYLIWCLIKLFILCFIIIIFNLIIFLI